MFRLIVCVCLSFLLTFRIITATLLKLMFHTLWLLICLFQIFDEYKPYLCVVALHPEPIFFTQAKTFDVRLTAMDDELLALESTDTWSICSLPPGNQAIGCNWVYKLKFHADGSLECYKARLVVKGYTQKE